MKWVKHNVDASFSPTENTSGVGICLRDDCGIFIVSHTFSFQLICDVQLGDAM